MDFFEDEGTVASRELREECAALHFEALELAGIEVATMHISLDGPVSFALASALPADLGFKQQLLAMRSDADRTDGCVISTRQFCPGSTPARTQPEAPDTMAM